jgi:hypothetical protein
MFYCISRGNFVVRESEERTKYQKKSAALLESVVVAFKDI